MGGQVVCFRSIGDIFMIGMVGIIDNFRVEVMVETVNIVWVMSMLV